MIRAAVLLPCLALCGCLSVPLSTIARMSSFDQRDFAQLDPAVLRVRVTLPEGFTLNPARSWLGVEIASDAGTHSGEFRLDRLATRAARVSGGVFSGDRPATAWTMRLSEASREEFRRLQAFVARGKPGDVTIRVVPILSAFPPDAATTRVWIDLLLTEPQGWFTLLDGAEVPLEKIREASTRS